MWTEYLVILFKITDISPFLSWRPVSTHTVGYFPETDTVLRQLTVISYLCFLQLLRQRDEILSCLFSSTWQGTGVTSGRIEWPSCKKVSCQQVRHHDTRTHAPAVDSVTVKSYTLLPFTNWQLHARPTDSFRGEAENLTKFLLKKSRLRCKIKTIFKKLKTRLKDKNFTFLIQCYSRKFKDGFEDFYLNPLTGAQDWKCAAVNFS